MHLSGQAHMLLNRVISINLGFLASGDDGSSPATTECAQEVLGFRGCIRREQTSTWRVVASHATALRVPAWKHPDTAAK